MAMSFGKTTSKFIRPSPQWQRWCLYALCAMALLIFDVPHGASAPAPVVVTTMPVLAGSSDIRVTLQESGAPPILSMPLQNPADSVRNLVTHVSVPIVSANTGRGITHTSFVLYPTASLYASATSKYFGSNAATAAADTGGFTVRSTVAIPIYKYQSTAALVNTTTHELTHAVLNNAGIGQKLPTWMNEGFAWYNGMQAERQLDPSAVSMLTKQLRMQLETARQKSRLLPLDAPVAQIIQMNQVYNVEFVDYLAVNHLITQYGIHNFRHFLNDIRIYGVNLSFILNFHTSLGKYESSFLQTLT